MSDFNISSSHAVETLPAVSDLVVNSIQIINLIMAAEIIGTFGIVANIVNIRVFRKLGYQDGVNITLTALAVSDIGALVFLEIYITLMNPWIQETDLIIFKSHLLYLVVYCRQYFIRCSCLITSFAAFERCICVVFPLKVKNIITVEVVALVNISIFILMIFYLVPSSCTYYIDWTYISLLHKNILSFVYKSNRDSVLSISHYFTDFLLPYGTFSTLIICSIIIYFKLKSKSKWRQSATNAGGKLSNLASYKERKSASMLLTVSVMCVLCVLPQSLLFTVFGVVRELKTNSAYRNINNLFYSFTSLLETINCSVTIFVYYKMSTNYRSEFLKMFFNIHKETPK